MIERSDEKRIFRRYKRETEFLLKIDAERYRCKTIDYSADGLCLHILDRAPSFPQGKVIQVDIEEYEIDFLGEVIWSKPSLQGLIVGFRRVGAIKGSCQEFRLPDILLGLQRSMKTGTLVVTSGSRVTKIFIKGGDMVFARSNREDDRFGEVLLKEGQISLEQYFEASELLKSTGNRLGAVLIKLGYLDATDLTKAVRHQVMEIIVSILISDCGYFEFEEGPLTANEAITLNLSAANLIYHSIKRINNFQYILQDFPSLDTVLCLSEDPMDLFQDLALDDTGKEILSRIDGETPIRDILTPELMNDFETIKSIYAFLSARIIVERKKDQPQQYVTPEEIISEPLAEIDQEFVKMVDDMYDICQTANYYKVLGVKSYATTDEIKKAYFSLAKEFHPDRHFAISSEDTKRKLNEILGIITEAYNALSDLEEREEYDESLQTEPDENIAEGDLTVEQEAEKKFEEGRSKMLHHSYIEAEQLFAEAISIAGFNAKYHYYRGLALNRLSFYKEASKELKEAVRLDPDMTNYHTALGFTFYKLGFKQRAKSSFRKALDISPFNEKAIEGLRAIDGNIDLSDENVAETG
ncbi:MAG: DnaJ domain-containing protein [Nitrospirota bacterium]|nr:MAG: DnaJ domain-containing protein [Nitrospirota bacterium]